MACVLFSLVPFSLCRFDRRKRCHLLVFLRGSVTVNNDEPLFTCVLAVYASPPELFGVPACILCLFFLLKYLFVFLLGYAYSCILQTLIPGSMLQTRHSHFYLPLLKAVCGLFCYITVFHCYIVISKSITSFVMSSFGLC